MAVPKLRFKEFTDEWKETKIDACIETLKSGLSRELQSKDTGLPVIRANNIVNSRIDLTDLKYWYYQDPQGANTANYFLKKGDILINFINSESKMGTSALISKDFERDMIYTTNILKLTTNKLLLNSFFQYHTLLPKYRYYIKSITKPAVNQASFTTVDFRKYLFSLPSKVEQQKIADFLSLLDRKIALQEKKIALLKDYKKGVLQRMVDTDNTLNVIKLRFPGFTDDFETCTLGNLLIPTSKKTVSNISEYKKITIKLNLNGIEFARNDREMVDTRPFYIRKAGELIIGKQNYFNGSIAIIDKKYNGTICSNAIMSFTSNNCNIFYIYTCISQRNFIKQHEFFANGTGQKELSEKDFLKFNIKYPSIKEQDKISNFIKEYNQKISCDEIFLVSLKKLKSALFQKMFI